MARQAITWANGDPVLCRNMASLGHNDLCIHTHTHIYIYMKQMINKNNEYK